MIRSIDLFRSSSRPPATQADNEKSAAGKSCILVVAASSQIHTTVEQSLESLGMELVILGSGEAADEFLLKNSASVVISEINLPMMSGLTLARKIKENRSLQNTPILLVSDSAEGPDKVLGMETGADDYITLPINPAELRSRVMSLLARTPKEPAEETSASIRTETEIGAGAVAIPEDEIGLGTTDEPEPEPVDQKPETADEAAGTAAPGQTAAADSESEDFGVPDEALAATEESAVPELEPDLTHRADGATETDSEIVDVSGSGAGDDAVNPFNVPTENVVTPDSDIVQEEIEQPPAEAGEIPGVSDQVEEADPETDTINAGSMLDDIFGGSGETTITAPSSVPADPAAAAPVDTPPEVIRQEPPPAETPLSDAVETMPPTVTEQQISEPAPETTAPQSQPAQVPEAPVQPPPPPIPVEQSIEESTIIPADEQAAPPAVPPQSDVPPVGTGEVSQPPAEVLPEYDFNKEVDHREVYSTALADLREFETAVVSGAEFDFNSLIRDARRIVSSVNQSNYLQIRAMGRREGDDFPVHSLNVGIYSVKLSTGLKYENKLMVELALSALLHDVGMLLIPDEIRKAKRKLSDEEMITLKNHPVKGSEYLTNAIRTRPELAQFEFLPTVAFQEHERTNGAGYPNAVESDEIHDYAKIVAIIDMYEAVSHPASYRNEYLAYEALQKVVALKDSHFDVKFLRALVREISVFPIDSIVRLNNGDIGKVIGLDSSHPMRPKLNLLCNADGVPYDEGKEIELAKSPFLYVETPVSEEEFEKLFKN